jgi:hypothetical protein
MFADYQAPLQLAHWEQKLPAEVDVPSRTAPISLGAFLRVIRAELLPFITYGPSYERAVAENLRRALNMYVNGRGEEFTYWLGETLRAGVQARARTAEPFDPGFAHVTATAWAVSYSTGADIEGAALNVYDVDDRDGVGPVVYHPVYNGLRFRSVDDASEFAYKAGLIKRHAPRWAAARA